MAIRDGLALDLGGVEQKRSSGTRRGGGPAPARGPRTPSRPWSVGAGAAALVILILASALAYYSLQRPPEEPPRLELSLPKSSYSSGEVVQVTVWLDNRRGGDKVYDLPTPQLFMLEVHNESGLVVAARDTGADGSPTELRLGAGERRRLGTFEWNQTSAAVVDGNATWEQVPPGTYRILAWLNGHMEVQAEREIDIA